MTKNWTAGEIAEACPAKQITRDVISKRIRNAKTRFEPAAFNVITHARVRKPRKPQTKSRKPKGNTSVSVGGAQATPTLTNVSNHLIESHPTLLGENPIFTVTPVSPPIYSQHQASLTQHPSLSVPFDVCSSFDQQQQQQQQQKKPPIEYHGREDAHDFLEEHLTHLQNGFPAIAPWEDVGREYVALTGF